MISKEIIEQAVGKEAINLQNESLGQVVDLKYGSENNAVHYLILKCSNFEKYDKGNHYFAIPACHDYVKISEGAEMKFDVRHPELQSAKGLRLQDCPTPPPSMSPLIYEIYDYKA